MRSGLNFITFWGGTLVFFSVLGALVFCGLWFGSTPRKGLAWLSLVVFAALIVADLLIGREAMCELTGRRFVPRVNICTG